MKKTNLLGMLLASFALTACIDSVKDNSGNSGDIRDEGSKIAFTERTVPVNRGGTPPDFVDASP